MVESRFARRLNQAENKYILNQMMPIFKIRCPRLSTASVVLVVWSFINRYCSDEALRPQWLPL